MSITVKGPSLTFTTADLRHPRFGKAIHDRIADIVWAHYLSPLLTARTNALAKKKKVRR